MEEKILDTDVQQFIADHLNADISTLALQGTPFSVSTKVLVTQIQSKKKCFKKLPTWFATPQIYYPQPLQIAQTSSEITANYKAQLIKGETIIDLTGGLGVDSYYLAKRFARVIHCEIDPVLSTIVKHNYKQLGVKNIDVMPCDGIDYLSDSKEIFDWIYVDPARRHATKGKVFFLKDCHPDITEHLGLCFEHSKNILIKTSPLLDLSIGIRELKNVKTIHILAVDNEVKELLWELEKNNEAPILINAVNIEKNQTVVCFDFLHAEESHTKARYSSPKNYLYEPHAAILKSGAFNLISERLKVFKLHKHTHLYTSAVRVDFPGRCFQIQDVCPYNKRTMRKLAVAQANVATRNFPETVHQIRQKFKIKDGGNTYLFFVTSADHDKLVLVARRL